MNLKASKIGLTISSILLILICCAGLAGNLFIGHHIEDYYSAERINLINDVTDSLKDDSFIIDRNALRDVFESLKERDKTDAKVWLSFYQVQQSYLGVLVFALLLHFIFLYQLLKNGGERNANNTGNQP